MHKLKNFMLLAFTCVILSSCNLNQNINEAEPYNPINPDYKNNFTETVDNCVYVGYINYQKAGDKLLFYNLKSGYGNYPFAYVNEKTGNVNNFCTDQACSHDNDDCAFFYLTSSPFFNMTISYNNDTFYYTYLYFDSDTPDTYIVSSDSQGQNKKLIYISKNDMSPRFLIPTTDYFYFTKYNEDGFRSIYRISNGAKEPELVEINEKNSHIENMIIINDDIFYYQYFDLYKYNINNKNSELIAEKISTKYQTDKNFLFYTTEDTSIKPFKRDLYKSNLKTGEKTLLRENVDYFFMTDDNIYFSYNSDVVINGPNISNNVEDRINGKIYRMDKNGENEELVFEAENLYIQDYAVCGDYVYMSCDGYDSYFANKGAYKLCRVNIFSDEKKLVEVTRDNKFNEFIIPTPVNVKFVSGN